jgi:uncharacterized Zn finger protein
MKRGAPKKRTSSKGRRAGKDWNSLTWDDLERWAGPRSVSRGRSYQSQGRVEDLAISEDGRLLATVRGGDRYIVSVWLLAKRKGGEALDSHCTCPVGYSGCKHAVAVVADYLEALANETVVPTADPDERRWSKLDGSDAEYEAEDLDGDWESDEEWESDDEEDEESEPVVKPRRKASRGTPRRTRAEWDEKIREHIQGKGREELAEFVCSLVERFPELREEFRERIALGEGDVDRLVAQARREMRERTSEIGWQNHWKGEGYTPDYSRLKHRLERLLELGHADAVVGLGRGFIGRAMSQVEQSHDEGETATAAAECFPVVFDAVLKSSLSAPQKLLFAIDACLQDDYDVVGESAGQVLDAPWQREDWSGTADELQRRLKQVPKTRDDDWSRDYRRDRISNWLSTALENAGRSDEVLALYEAEARATGSYVRLVKHWIGRRKYEDAERWAKEGIERTREKLPGVASDLANSLCEVAERRKQWDVVAAHAARYFFERPGTERFKELVAKAKKAQCEEAVRAAALRFLETGVSPIQWTESRKGERSLRIDAAWPLPVPDYLEPLFTRARAGATAPRPHYDVLLDMAIAAKKPDDVLHWFDKMSAQEKRVAGRWGGAGPPQADRVAEAVAKSHPERALAIYRNGLDANLPQANISAYGSAAAYLKRMRPIMKLLGREGEWTTLLAEVRQKYGNRPRFMEILDRLEGRTVLQSQKACRRR